MGAINKSVELEKVFSLADDLVGVLNDGNDAENLMQSLENAKLIHSFCKAKADETKISLEEYQKRINECNEKIEKAKSEGFSDSNLDDLQTDLEKKMQMEHLLHEELRVVSDELGGLEHQRISIEERWQLVKQISKDVQKSQDSISMCASVTSIIPDHNDKMKISGIIVNRSKKKVEIFEFDPATSHFEVCNKLWTMSS